PARRRADPAVPAPLRRLRPFLRLRHLLRRPRTLRRRRPAHRPPRRKPARSPRHRLHGPPRRPRAPTRTLKPPTNLRGYPLSVSFDPKRSKINNLVFLGPVVCFRVGIGVSWGSGRTV